MTTFTEQYKQMPAGFTLLEVLVALMITSLVAVTAIGTLSAITNSRERVNRNVLMMDNLRYASQMAQRDLQCLYRDGDREQMSFYAGTREDEDGEFFFINFKTVYRGRARTDLAESDIYEVEYYLKSRDANGTAEESVDGLKTKRLMRRLDPYPSTKKVEIGGVVSRVAEHIIDFRARFMNPETNEWMMEWNSQELGLPSLIEVSLAILPPERREPMYQTFLVGWSRLPAEESGRSEGNNNDDNRGNQRRGNDSGGNVENDRQGNDNAEDGNRGNRTGSGERGNRGRRSGRRR